MNELRFLHKIVEERPDWYKPHSWLSRLHIQDRLGSYPSYELFQIIAYEGFQFGEVFLWKLKPFEELTPPCKKPRKLRRAGSVFPLPPSPLGLYSEIHRKHSTVRRYRLDNSKHKREPGPVYHARMREDRLFSFDRRESTLKKITTNHT